MWLRVILAVVATALGLNGPRVAESSLDVNELLDTRFAVEISGSPVLDTFVSQDENLQLVKMVNKFGQKYNCQLPLSQDDEDGGDVKREELTNDQISADIEAALASMGQSSCLTAMTSWWTYDFCYGKYISQYRLEGGAVSGNTIILGYYDHDAKFEKEDVLAHHSQFFSNGSVCDLTGQRRKAEVVFICDPNAAIDAIVSIKEPYTCEYVLTVSTKRLCNIAHMMPVTPKGPKRIVCSPLLSSQQYEQFQRREKKLQELSIKRRQEAKERHKLKMLSIFQGDEISDVVEDLDTDEGYRRLEAMFEAKVSERLIRELENILNPTSSQMGKPGPFSIRRIFGEEFGQSTTYFPSNKDRFLNIVAQNVQNKKEKVKKTDFTDEYTAATKSILKDGARIEEASHLADEHASYDLDSERKVRSDVVSEEDMLEELFHEVLRKTKSSNGDLRSVVGGEEFKREVEASLKEIVEETEREAGGAKVSYEEKMAILDEFTKKFEDIVAKAERGESDAKEKDVQTLNDESELLLGGDREHYKHDNKRSVKKELREEEFFETEPSPDHDGAGADAAPPVDAVNAVDSVGGGGSQLAQKLEARIKKKIDESGLSLEGRAIQVKVFSPDLNFGDVEADIDGLRGLDGERYKEMLYNLMVGNMEGYADMENLRKSEQNYKFSLDEPDDPETQSQSNAPLPTTPKDEL